MKRTAVEWLVEALRERGVDWMAALCGHGLDPLFDAATRAGIRLIDTRNEQTAAYIAEGTAGSRAGRASAPPRAALPWRTLLRVS